MKILMGWGVFFLSLSAFAAREYSFENNHYAIHYEEKEDHQEIHFSGQILPMFAGVGLKNLKSMLVPDKNILFVIQYSGGGYGVTFKGLGEALRKSCKRKNNCQVTMYVQDKCASACVDLFMYGHNRWASSYAEFGFHRAWIINPRIVVGTARSIADGYIKLGANKEWLYSNLWIFREDQVEGTWLRSDELLEAKIVTEIRD